METLKEKLNGDDHKKQTKLSDATLGRMYKTNTAKQIAEKSGIPIGTIRSRIKVLQSKGQIITKIKTKKKNTPIVKESKPTNIGLAAILDRINEQKSSDISTNHKEMLIEILHRIIVK